MKITGANAIQTNIRTAPQPRVAAMPQDNNPAPGSTVSISSPGKALSEGTRESTGGESIADIMSGRSLRNIRYSELVSVAGKLRDAGHLAEKDYLDFIGPSPEFATVDGSRNPDWDAPVDYIGRHEMNIAFMTSTGSEQRHIDFEKHLLSLYRSFEP